MAISDHIERVRQNLREGRYHSEAAVSQGIVLPTLHELGWPVFNTSIVIPEYSIEGRRVDYALCHPESHPVVFIEVKKVGLSDGADRQLFEYAFMLGVPMAILTDGQEWSFYLPGEQGRYDERRIYKIDLLEREVSEAEARLVRYLSYENVCSGKALEAARLDYRNVARDRIIASTLSKAWQALLNEPDSLLLEMFAEKVEDICGYRPELEVCNQFIEREVRGSGQLKKQEFSAAQPVKSPERPSINRSRPELIERSGVFDFDFNGRRIEARSACEAMLKLFKLLAQEDGSFLEHFASRRHGKKRRYLAKDKLELYPGRPDLAALHSVEILPGWWMGTNYSRPNIQDIINLALEVASPELRSKIRINVL
ncbi:MAG TPA: hypothetical protein P5539_16890 [Mesotoga sp.]|jgi:hypothetical protein|nr:hypothetical protein [Mesotoga sp.]HRV03377.1 hypothetical protein [Mesotoga sp.]